MSDPSEPETNTRDARIGRILCELHDRKARGEVVRFAEVKAAYPDLAEELDRYLGLLGAVQRPDDDIHTLFASDIFAEADVIEKCARLGAYQTLEPVGRGGMGIVLKAYEQKLNRLVALKILRPEFAKDKIAVERFTREAKSAGALRHPNIVTVFAVGKERGIHFLAMEYIDGPTLAGLIRDRGPLLTDTIRRMFRELLSGLAAAHDAGLIHRDIKSANILLDGPDLRVKIVDFGLARMMGSQTQITIGDSILGTAEYMSPEQVRGDADIDHRTDLYSAGVVLFEMLTGGTAFGGGSPSTVLHRILHEEPADPRTIQANADANLSSLAMRLMAKRPEDRFASAAEVIEALDAGTRVGSLQRRRKTRSRVLIGCTIALVSCLAAITARELYIGSNTITKVWIEGDTNPRTVFKQCRFGADREVFLDFGGTVHDVTDVALLDLDGNGRQAVCAALLGASNQDLVRMFDPIGVLEWQHDFRSDIHWPDCQSPGAFSCNVIEAGNMDGLLGDELLVVVTDSFEYATSILLIDPRSGEVHARYWHIGNIPDAFICPDFLGPGRPAIAARCVNNKLDGFESPQEGDAAPLVGYEWVAAIMILDPRQMEGERLIAVPPASHRINLPPVLPVAYGHMDLPENTSVPGVSAGRANTFYVSEEETAFNKTLRQIAHPDDGTRSCLNAIFVREENGRNGTEYVLNSNLEPLRVFIGSGERYACDESYWRSHWHVIVKHGEYCGDAAEKWLPSAATPSSPQERHGIPRRQIEPPISSSSNAAHESI